MERIGVFCSASDRIDDIYVERVREWGVWLGRQGKTLVYGGSDQGLMECLALAVKENGGRVVGVVPSLLEKRGRASRLPDKVLRAETLSDRKDKMVAESDILVALPGGVGTLDEMFHVIASATIGYHSKKVIVYNINGFYDKLIAFLEQLETSRFAHCPLQRCIEVVATMEELIAKLN